MDDSRVSNLQVHQQVAAGAVDVATVTLNKGMLVGWCQSVTFIMIALKFESRSVIVS